MGNKLQCLLLGDSGHSNLDLVNDLLNVCFRPKADVRNESIHGTFAVTIWNSLIMGGQTKIRLFSDNQG